LLKEIERMNLDNKDKGMLENLVQAIEEKIGSAGKFVKDKVKDLTNGESGESGNFSSPSTPSSGSSSEQVRIL